MFVDETNQIIPLKVHSKRNKIYIFLLIAPLFLTFLCPTIVLELLDTQLKDFSSL
jgi:hypothetical protein